jgi:serine/threonine protein kinase
MAEVWSARMRGKHGFERLFAIKTILEEYEGGEGFRKMFLDEARIAAGIQHQNVAQILDVGEENDVPYLVMEYVDGDSLSALRRTVERRGVDFPVGIALRILADTCGGLAAAHQLRDNLGTLLGVVHRDVSPQNILVSTNGMVKLIDFGIAKARERIADVTSSGMLKGKLEYMAPEQALGRAIDHRADLWSIGAVLYLLLAGRPPFRRDDEAAFLRLLASGPEAPPLPSGTPEAVNELVRMTLQHDPERRVQTASLLQRAIETAIVDTGLHTTTADVAAFIATHLGDRAERRRVTIEQAITVASAMTSAEEAPASSMPAPPLSGADGKESNEGKESKRSEEGEKKPGIPMEQVPAEPPAPAAEALATEPPATEATTDSSSLESSMLDGERPSLVTVRRRNQKVVLGIVGVAAALLVAGGALSYARRQSQPSADKDPREKTREEPTSKSDEPAEKSEKDPPTPAPMPPPPAPPPSSEPKPQPSVVASTPPAAVTTATKPSPPPPATTTAKPPPPQPTIKPPTIATTKKKPPVINEGF